MKLTSWILFGLAIALTLGVLAMVARQSRMTPKEYFERVQARSASGASNREQTIAELDSVIDRAIEMGEVEVTSNAQLLRGRTLMDLGAYDRAREDLSAVAALRPGDVTVENDLTELETRTGDFRAAQDRITRIIQRDPANLSAYVRLGSLYRQSADRSLERMLERLRRALLPDQYERARRILEQSTALLPADPRRVALADELRLMLTGDGELLLEDAVNVTDQACREYDHARQAYTASLQRGVDPEAVAGLIRTFERAGRTELGVDLGTTTVRIGALRTNPAFASALLNGLVELGRLRYAADLATAWFTPQAQPQIPADFAAQCCTVLWQAKRWTTLTQAAFALGQIGSLEQISTTYLYTGLAQIELGDFLHGRQNIYRFCATETPDPFRHARAIAWQYIARASRELGEPIPERMALQGLVDLEPELVPEAWLRLAQLQMESPHGGYREPELRFARGMRLLPERTAELMPRWTDIGVQELRTLGLDLSAVKADLAHDKIWTPSADASPYELYKLAELHADAGDTLRAATHVRKLLEKVPGFVPALDLAIRVADMQDKPKQRMEYLIERVRLAGRTSAIDAILRTTSLSELPPETLLALMRADPDRSGRLAIADGLARDGRTDEALALIQDLEKATLGDEGRILLGRLYLTRHEPERALALLAPLVPDIYSQPEGIELLVNAALGARDVETLNQLGSRLANLVGVPSVSETRGATREFVLARPRALWVVDQLLAFGMGEAAQPILEALDANPRLRGGDVNLRLAGAALARGDLPAVHEALERAQAFDTRGLADYLALLLAAYEERGDDLQRLAGTAAASNAAGGPLLAAQFLILLERGDEAQDLLKAGLSGIQKDDPWWNLSRYALSLLDSRSAPFTLSPFLGRSAEFAAQNFFLGADHGGDARLALAWVGAMRVPTAAPFVRAWLDRQARTAGGSNLWLEWMRATLDAHWGANGSALAIVKRVRSRIVDFGPAWNLEEAILSKSQRSQEELQSARARRVAALGELSGTPLERLIDAAHEKATAGLFEDALADATAAGELDPTSIRAAVASAEIQLQMQRRIPALMTLRTLLATREQKRMKVFSAATAREGADFVAVYLRTLDEARQLDAGTISQKRAEQLLEQLRERAPDDPRVVLALADLQLGVDRLNPTLGVGLAYSTLDRFRAEHKHISLSRLAPDAVRSWARFLTRLDPSRARRFVEEELALAPTETTTWIELARALEAEGDYTLALAQLRLAARLLPRGIVEREILRLRSQSEIAYDEIEAAVGAIVTSEGLNGPDAELSILNARCIMNQGPRALERVAQLLARADPATLPAHLAAEHGLLTSTYLLMRGRPADKQAAQPVVDTLRRNPALDPYQRAFVEALDGLSRAP